MLYDRNTAVNDDLAAGKARKFGGMLFRGMQVPQAGPGLQDGFGSGGVGGVTATPPYAGRRPLFGAPMANDPAGLMPVPAPPVDPQKGFFQRNGLGVNLLGALADGVSTAHGLAPAFATARNQQLARQRQIQDREAEREANMQDWIAKQEYERTHPAPVRNDTMNDYEFLRQKLGQEQADQYLRNFAAGPVMAVEGFDAAGNPTKTFVPRGSIGGARQGAGGGPSNTAIDYLRKNPNLAAQFDEKYGVGASARYLGGAPSRGGATFSGPVQGTR